MFCHTFRRYLFINFEHLKSLLVLASIFTIVNETDKMLYSTYFFLSEFHLEGFSRLQSYLHEINNTRTHARTHSRTHVMSRAQIFVIYYFIALIRKKRLPTIIFEIKTDWNKQIQISKRLYVLQYKLRRILVPNYNLWIFASPVHARRRFWNILYKAGNNQLTY